LRYSEITLKNYLKNSATCPKLWTFSEKFSNFFRHFQRNSEKGFSELLPITV